MKNLADKKYMPFILVALCAAGLLLILFSGNSDSVKDSKADGNTTELEQYGKYLEERFESIVCGIVGGKDVQVMITFDSSFEKVYAGNASVEEGSSGVKTSEKQLVLAGGGTSSEEPVLLKEICPRVRGVAVICKKANEETKNKIKDAAVSLFGISELHVYVSENRIG